MCSYDNFRIMEKRQQASRKSDAASGRAGSTAGSTSTLSNVHPEVLRLFEMADRRKAGWLSASDLLVRNQCCMSTRSTLPLTYTYADGMRKVVSTHLDLGYVGQWIYATVL